MATLENVQGGSLVPDNTGALNLLLETFGTGPSRQRDRDVQEQVDVLARGPGGKKRERALVRLTALNPQLATSIQGILQSGDTAEIARAAADADKVFKRATFFQNQKSFPKRQQAILNEANKVAANNEDPKPILDLLNLPEDELSTELQRQLTMTADVKDLTKVLQGGPGTQFLTRSGQPIAEVPLAPAKPGTEPELIRTLKAFGIEPGSKEGKEIARRKFLPDDPVLSDIGKLNRDLKNKKITKKDRDAKVEKILREREPLVKIVPESTKQRLDATSDAEVRDEVRTNARLAGREKGRIKRLQNLLKRSEQGAFTQFLPAIARVLPGIDADDEQAALAQINSRVLDIMNAFKGNTSDRELNFAQDAVEQLGNSVKANQIITRGFLNMIFLAELENKQFDRKVASGTKPRDFIFDFEEIVIPDHPKFGNVTVSDLQETAFTFGLTMEDTIRELGKQENQ